MNRNTESHFALNPTSIDISRSRFDRSSGLKTTFNAGELIPIFVDEVLPGDTWSMQVSKVVRMSTPIHPTMDNSYIDVYWYAIPFRLVWEHWKEFNGENTQGAWTQQVEYQIPQVTAPATTGWQKGTIADYMGLPIGVDGLSVSSLYFRAYCMVWNDWFRDENLQDPTNCPLDDTIIVGSNGGVYQTDACKGGKPLPVAKYHDYFTSALPQPQKGPDVLLPLGSIAPVIADSSVHGITSTPLKFVDVQTGVPTDPGTVRLDRNGNLGIQTGTSGASSRDIAPNNLYTDLSQATSATVNELRLAFQVQKLYEKDARGGSRYTEILRSHFGVTSPDARQQRPEYLGGNRVPINISQVLQTSSTDSVSPQGNTAAYSLTGDVSGAFTKSFTEHSILLGLACVRTDHTYQQGIERFWSRKTRLDYYWPVLANIGEQAILNKEIYAQGNAQDDEVFGYQEAWAEYRYKPSRVSGSFRSTSQTPLDSWHYADYYTQLPTLGSDWIKETKVNIDRTLAVSSSVEDQFIADFQFNCYCTRPMPMYSVPGLVDHH